LQQTPALREQAWKRWRIKDTKKGPMVWETKHVQFIPKDENGLPAEPRHLIVARNVRDVLNVKFFVSNAPSETPLAELLHVAFSRWRIERCFEDQKTELGFDHFEGRSYIGLKRHQAITAVSHLFLSEIRHELRGEKTGVDRLPGEDRDGRFSALLGSGPHRRKADPRRRSRRNRIHPKAQRAGASLPYANHSEKTRRRGHSPDWLTPMRLEQPPAKLAL
jgi:hypothetical protein